MSIHILDILHLNASDRAARRQLEQEIAGYQTEADRHDLEAALDRYSDEETLEIRQILAQHAA